MDFGYLLQVGQLFDVLGVLGLELSAIGLDILSIELLLSDSSLALTMCLSGQLQLLGYSAHFCLELSLSLPPPLPIPF